MRVGAFRTSGRSPVSSPPGGQVGVTETERRSSATPADGFLAKRIMSQMICSGRGPRSRNPRRGHTRADRIGGDDVEHLLDRSRSSMATLVFTCWRNRFGATPARIPEKAPGP